MSEGADDFGLLLSIEVGEIEVVGQTGGCAVVCPSFPSPSMVGVCFSLNCGLMGSVRSKEVIQEAISLGSGTMLKECGTCDGKCLKM